MLWLILCFVHCLRCNDVLFVATLYALATFQARDCPTAMAYATEMDTTPGKCKVSVNSYWAAVSMRKT